MFKPSTNVFAEAKAEPAPKISANLNHKAADLVGKAPMAHDPKVSNVAIPAGRVGALTAIFGSGKMENSLAGANKSQ